MKGVILTAGQAKRLRPITNAYGKVLVPIYNKPMIDYGVSLFISCGVKDIILVCNKTDIKIFKQLFKRFDNTGMNINYCVQKTAKGTANALLFAKKFVKNEDFVLLFGDNIFISKDMPRLLGDAINENAGLTLFAKRVKDPERFGVIEHDENFNILSMEEKPAKPKTNLASTGLYVYKGDAMRRAGEVKLSVRGEYELTDVIDSYIREKKAKVVVLGEDCEWLDTGTHDSLLKCSEIVRDFESKNGVIGSIERALLDANLISQGQFEELIKGYCKDYSSCLRNKNR